MAAVAWEPFFRAQDEQLDRVVAIKVIPFVGEDVDLRRRFHNEAKSAAKLDHPRIAKIYAVGHRGDWHYIVFEYIHGTNIRDLVTSGGVLNIDDAVYYTCELAAALQHAADRGIVHRDIKPSNVLVGDDSNIKLVDMGLARSDNLELSEDMTASGVTLGTFDYISPEQAHDPRVADLRSDLYSLGCTLYFMLTGSPPYPGGTMLQKLLSHGNAPAPDPRELRPDVSQDLASVIQKMLAKDPKDRYQNANDLISDLQTVAFRDGLVRAQGTRSVVVQEPSEIVVWLERHASWIVAMAILLVSAGWLYLMSADTRKEFTLTPPPSAEPPQRYTPAQNRDRDRTPQEQPREPTIEIEPGSIDSAKGVAPDAAPPSLPVPIPEELLTDTSAFPDTSDNSTGDDVRDPGRSLLPTDPNSELRIPDASLDALPGEPLIAPREIRVLGRSEGMDLLADPRERYDDGVLLSASLSEAIDLAAKYGTSRILIDSPVIYTEPLTIKSDGLWIHSAIPDGTVVIVQPGEPASMERARMINLGSNRIELEDLHFVWDVSSRLIEGGSMFAVHDNRKIRLNECSITVNNPSSIDEVYAFDIVTDPEAIDWSSRELSARDDFSLQLVAIEMNNVIVRGQMTMIHMDFATELQLQWENGLLAISERMIDTAGARIQPPLASAPIRLSLSRLTARIPLGLMRMRLGASGPYPVAIDRDSRNSLFVTNRDQPYVELLGLRALDQQADLLQLRGEANVYVADEGSFETMLRRSDQEDQSTVVGLSQISAAAPGWFTEASHGRSVRWSSGRLTDVAPNRVEPSHFQQDGTVLSGFDDRFLTQMPEMLTGDGQVDTAANEL